MTYPPYGDQPPPDPYQQYPGQYGQQPGYGQQSGYGPQPEYGSPPPPPPKAGMSAAMIAVVSAVVVIVIGGGITTAILLTGKDDSSPSGQASNSVSASTSASSTPSASSAPATQSGGLGPGPTTSLGSTSAAQGHSCQLPSDGTSEPGLAADGIIDDLTGNGTLTTPTVAYTTTSSSGTLKSYCFDDVEQADLNNALAFLFGAGYTQSDGTVPAQQQLFKSTNTLKPSEVAITVTGTLKIDRNNYDANTGSVEIDWTG